MQEEWRPVVGYEKFYEVSNIGRVRSIKRNGTNGKVLAKILDNDGYHIVCLMVKQRKNKKVHRLVAEAFIPNPENKPQINHINNIRDDNNVSNLEWATALENNQHMVKQGRALYTGGRKDSPRDSLTGRFISSTTGATRWTRRWF